MGAGAAADTVAGGTAVDMVGAATVVADMVGADMVGAADMLAEATVAGDTVAVGITVQVLDTAAAGTAQSLDMAAGALAADTAKSSRDLLSEETAQAWVEMVSGISRLIQSGAAILLGGVTSVAGCSATEALPTSLCDHNWALRDFTVGSQVRPGLGGVAVSSLAGSDHCSGPTLMTTCSITFTGRMPTTTSGPMRTMTSTTASTALMLITAPPALPVLAAA